MARLGHICSILDNAHLLDVRQRRNLRRMARYADNAFAMGDDEFRQNYRVTKELFDVLLNELELFDVLLNELEPLMSQPTRRSDISTKYKILVALSFYATGSYQRLVGETQGTMMSQQSVSRALREVTDALNSDVILNKWLQFPQTRQERDVIKRRFFEKIKIPCIVGCIDGTHVALVKPSHNEERFYNRKGYHSRNVLIICDADLNIMSVDATYGGATHDSFIWNEHPIKMHISDLTNARERVFLLGDSGYAQREYMMTPILNAPPGSAEEYYTNLHCVARNTVERTIGVLKNRWRCLIGDRVLHYHPDKVSKIINACCVLHNICNKARLDEDGIETTIPLVADVPWTQEEGIQGVDELRRGVQARAQLVQELWAARRT